MNKGVERNFKVDLLEVLLAFSHVVDNMIPALANHHLYTAFIADNLYQVLQDTTDLEVDRKLLFYSAILHDIGALTSSMKLELIDIDETQLDVDESHSKIGFYLLSTSKLFEKSAEVVLYHHAKYNVNPFVPIESQIIDLADKVAIFFSKMKKENILFETQDIVDYINLHSNTVFNPTLVKAFNELAKYEYFWLDLADNAVIIDRIRKTDELHHMLNKKQIEDVVEFLRKVIDYRSSWTATHSVGVAKVAEEIAKVLCFTESELWQIRIAGFLHDIGKLAVDNKILDKPSKLTTEEFAKVRVHTYYSYRILEPFGPIAKIAAFHHEKLNGTGYPFHLSYEDLSLKARIMAVADIFTALTEPRPYRDGMTVDEALKIMKGMATSNHIDENILNVLENNVDEINMQRQQVQLEALNVYEEAFVKSCEKLLA